MLDILRGWIQGRFRIPIIDSPNPIFLIHFRIIPFNFLPGRRLWKRCQSIQFLFILKSVKIRNSDCLFPARLLDPHQDIPRRLSAESINPP